MTTPQPNRRLRTLARAFTRSCPNCGGRPVFESYLKLRDSCPSCGLKLERGERDYFIGAYTINLIVAEMIVFFGGLAVLIGTWPDVPWTALMYGLALLMVAAPILLYPFSRQAWLACDLIFRPPEPSDFGPAPTGTRLAEPGPRDLQPTSADGL